jgi:hypothetical protein
MLQDRAVVSRDDQGIVLVDMDEQKAKMVEVAKIRTNLFGHGDILHVAKSESGYAVSTLYVEEEEKSKSIKI